MTDPDRDDPHEGAWFVDCRSGSPAVNEGTFGTFGTEGPEGPETAGVESGTLVPGTAGLADERFRGSGGMLS